MLFKKNVIEFKTLRYGNIILFLRSRFLVGNGAGCFQCQNTQTISQICGPMVGTEMAYTTTHTHTRTDVFKLVVQIEVRSFAMGTKFVQSLSATYKGEKKTHVDQFS